MKILLLTGNRQDATSFYRGSGIIKDLEKQSGHQIDVHDWNEIGLEWSSLSRYDLVYMQKPQSNMAVSTAKYLKLLKVKLWIDWDDDYLNIPVYHFFVLQLQADRENIVKLAELADVITVSTASLAKSYSEYNKNVIVIPNAIPKALFEKTKYNSTGDLFWRGSYLHFPNVIHYAQEIQSVIDSGAKIKFMGLNPFFLKSYTMLPEMELYNYFDNYKRVSPLFTFVVLINDVFNQGRSNISWIEATMAGTVCLAPEWHEWKLPGIITYNSREDFISKAIAMHKNEIDLEAHYEESFSYISENLILENVNKTRVELINSL